jgi:hypothetical protein
MLIFARGSFKQATTMGVCGGQSSRLSPNTSVSPAILISANHSTSTMTASLNNQLKNKMDEGHVIIN